MQGKKIDTDDPRCICSFPDVEPTTKVMTARTQQQKRLSWIKFTAQCIGLHMFRFESSNFGKIKTRRNEGGFSINNSGEKNENLIEFPIN